MTAIPTHQPDAPPGASSLRRSMRPGLWRSLRPGWLAVVLALVLGLGLAACSHQSVRHLERKPWAVNEAGDVQSKFWRFSYQTVTMQDGFGIRGVAYPRMNQLPPWVTWISELWMAVYVADEQGRVVADDVRVFVPEQLNPGQGVPFEFLLKPSRLESGRLYLTFGYRMTLTERSDDDPAGPGEAFFASESALERI